MAAVKVLAIDPGGTTGIAYYNTEWDKFNSWQADNFYDAMHSWATPDVLVIERFTIRQNTHKLSADAFEQTTDLIGAFRYLALRDGVDFIRQTPAQAKAFATDDKLKRLGWYTPGLPHGNDAARHLLTYLAGVRYTPILQRLVSEEDV